MILANVHEAWGATLWRPESGKCHSVLYTRQFADAQDKATLHMALRLDYAKYQAAPSTRCQGCHKCYAQGQSSSSVHLPLSPSHPKTSTGQHDFECIHISTCLRLVCSNTVVRSSVVMERAPT